MKMQKMLIVGLLVVGLQVMAGSNNPWTMADVEVIKSGDIDKIVALVKNFGDDSSDRYDSFRLAPYDHIRLMNDIWGYERSIQVTSERVYRHLLDLVAEYGTPAVMRAMLERYGEPNNRKFRTGDGTGDTIAENLFPKISMGDFGLSLKGIRDWSNELYEFHVAYDLPISNPLAVAVQRGDEEMVKTIVTFLKDRLTELNRLDLLPKYLNYGSTFVVLPNDAVLVYGTPLIIALLLDHKNIADFLIKSGAPIVDGAHAIYSAGEEQGEAWLIKFLAASPYATLEERHFLNPETKLIYWNKSNYSESSRINIQELLKKVGITIPSQPEPQK